jgi:hypothetical protein
MISFFDANVWGFLVVPVGVGVCFGPALLWWIKAEYFTPPEKRDSRRP